MNFSKLTNGSLPLLTLVLFLCAAAAPALVRADEIQERFDAAFQALNEERYYTAKELLSELIEDYPTLHRARLELARAEYLSSDLEAAEAQIQEVLKDPEVPPSVRTTLLAFLAQIRDDKQVFEDRHQWAGQVYGGLMYDSNVNFGTARDIGIGGFLLAKERDDGAGVASAGVLHTYNPNVRFRSGEKTGFFLWQTQGNAYYRGYYDETDFNLGVLTLRTGPTWLVPDEWRFNIGLQGDQIWYGGSDLGFFTSLNPNATWYLDDGVTEISAFVTLANRNYNRAIDVGRDGDLIRGGASIRRYYRDRRANAEIGIAYTDYEVDNNVFDFFSYQTPEAYVAGAYDAWNRGTIYGRIGFRHFDYDGQEPLPLPPASRDDDEWRLTAGFTHDIESGFLSGWAVRGEWLYTDNESSNPLFDFDRHQVSLGLERSF